MIADNARRDVLERFRDLLKAASVMDGIDRDHIVISRSYGANNALLGWGNHPYEAAINAAQGVLPKVSKKTIASALQNAVVKLFEDEAVKKDADPEAEAHLDDLLQILPSKAVTEEVEKLLGFLETRVRDFTVFIPVEGVELKTSQIEIGAHRLHRYGGRRDPLRSILDQARDDEHWKGRLEDLEQSFANAGCYVAVDEEGDAAFAQERGIEDGQDTVHVLNLYLATCRHRARRHMKIGLMGHPALGGRREVVCATPPVGEVGRHDIHYQGTLPPCRRYEIDRATARSWEGSGLDKIIEALRHGNANPGTIESRLRRSVIWHSKGVNGDGIDEQFVALAIALESLLVGPDEGSDPRVSWGSISQRIADRVAFLLGGDCAQRIAIARRAKTLYRLRSEIVHQGRTVSEANLLSMDRIVASAIQAFATCEFSSWDDFREWEQKQKYGSPYPMKKAIQRRS